jgi:hypothetical protein
VAVQLARELVRLVGAHGDRPFRALPSFGEDVLGQKKHRAPNCICFQARERKCSCVGIAGSYIHRGGTRHESDRPEAEIRVISAASPQCTELGGRLNRARGCPSPTMLARQRGTHTSPKDGMEVAHSKIARIRISTHRLSAYRPHAARHPPNSSTAPALLHRILTTSAQATSLAPP